MHNPEQEILQRFSVFNYWLPAVHGDDVIMPPAGAHNEKERLTTGTPLVWQHLVLDHI